MPTVRGLGLWTLFVKEVWRFAKNPVGSLIAPLITMYLFLAVFSAALGDNLVSGAPFLPLVAPGLIIMAIMLNAFENTAVSVMSYRNYGDFVDLLMPPLSPGQVALGMVAGGTARGLIVGVIAWISIQPFVTLVPVHPMSAIFHAAMAAALLSSIGVICGLWAEKWERLGAVNTFVIAPLTFLSGAFYSLAQLPEVWREIAQWNPFFYLIDGFRYGFIGRADGSLPVGGVVSFGMAIGFWALCYRLVATGYKLKP